MKTPTLAITGRLLAPWRRFMLLRKTRGMWRACYSLSRKLLKVTGLRSTLHLCASDLLLLPVSESHQPKRTPASYTVREAGAEDVAALADYYGSSAKVRRRLAEGNRCIITLCAEVIGAAVWLAPGPCEFNEDEDELSCTIIIPPNTAWTFDGRGTRLGAWGTLMARLPQLLPAWNVDTLATLIDSNNWQSLDAHVSLGYQTLGTFICTGTRWHRRPIYRSRSGPSRRLTWIAKSPATRIDDRAGLAVRQPV